MAGGDGGGRRGVRSHPLPPLQVSIRPPWPFRMPRRGGADGVSRVRSGVWERLMEVDGSLVLLRAWSAEREGTVEVAAMAVPAAWQRRGEPRPPASRPQLERAIARARHALAVDDDLSDFCARFRRDPLVGPAIRRRPWLRAGRCARAWEALACAVTEQLIEATEARAIQRRLARRWADAVELPGERRWLFDVPGPDALAAVAPAELTACGLAPKRSLALIAAAREVSSGRCDPADPDDDRRLLAISEIGPWTIQCLGIKGRGDRDALPSGDLAYVKLVGHLAGLDRRATVDEVERFYAPYAPCRGLAGIFTLLDAAPSMRTAKPLAYHPPRPELERAA